MPVLRKHRLFVEPVSTMNPKPIAIDLARQFASRFTLEESQAAARSFLQHV